MLCARVVVRRPRRALARKEGRIMDAGRGGRRTLVLPVL